LPFIVLLDATMMSVMYIGSVMFFEKKEATLSTILVTPVSHKEIILAKIIANTINNLFSSSLIIIAFVILKDVEIRIPLIIIGIVLTTVFFTGMGLWLSYYQKDFTTLLTNVMILMFVFLLPSALYSFKVLKSDIWEYILKINPIQAASELINAGFKFYEIGWEYYFSLGYVIFGGFIAFKFLIFPKFNDYAISISGV
jgi:fluoroquinolone transport system permease protein